MKFIHLSDLHLGKRICEISMLEEQRAIIVQILGIIDDESPDGIIIAGDVYDKSFPPTEAVQLFDELLCELAKRHLQVFIISGNHDSPERIAFGSRIMDASGIHLSPVYDGTVTPTTMTDDYGEVNVYMLPFIKPSNVRRFYENEEITTYTDAMRVAISGMNINPSKRNILVTHQFVTGAATCDSEEKSVGGSENVDASVFDDFDYVALGHIHGPQSFNGGKIRYCGTPLKYSFSEANHQKSVTIVELLEKGELTIRTTPLTPIHDMLDIRGTFAELTDENYYRTSPVTNDYLRITLTDENDIPDAYAHLRMIYKNLMNIRYDNARTREQISITGAADVEAKSTYELFAEFFEKQNNAPMSDIQSSYIKKLIEEIEEELP